jgi:hypothetical protein
VPGGHTEGYIEAFAQLYSDFAEQFNARAAGRDPDPRALLLPGVADGVRGMAFIEAVLDSHRRGGAWVAPQR